MRLLVQCVATLEKKGTLYPKDITDINGNPITYKDVLNSK